MEGCMEATARALKPSLRRELVTQQVFLDDVWCATGISGVLPCEDFSVDDLLDFSNGDFEEEGEEEEEEVGSVEEEDEKDSLSVSSSSQDPSVDVDDNNSNSSSNFDASYHESFLPSEFLEPVDEIAELEWVSQVMDDSSRSELSLIYPNYAGNRSQPDLKPVTIEPPCFPFSIPSKTRTKRPTTGRVWSLGCPVLNDSPASSSSSSGLSSTPCLVFTKPVQNQELLSGSDEPVAKKLKKCPVQPGGLFQRRCSHCQTQKTPQWRTGPHGPKTLCNACGVRYKSGRLFPEYRPACSPTFSREVHSNSHRKVLEMRKKKELAGPEVGFTHMVQSF